MMEDVERRIQALAQPIAAAFGCDVVAVRYRLGRKRAVVTLFLDTSQPEPTAEQWKEAARPFDPERDPAPPSYAGSRVSVEMCSRVSREVGAAIEAEGVIVGSHVLEVSSPGLERPLVRPADFLRHRGRRIELRLLEAVDGSRVIRGLLAAVDPEGIWVRPDRPGGGTESPRRVPFGAFTAARLVYEQKGPGGPGPAARRSRKR